MAAAAPGPRDGHGLLKSTAARLLGPLGPRAIMPRPASLGDAPANLSLAPEEPPPTPTDRPRKKLSFREPEILGYYMQMKQGVASRLSRRGKQGRAKAGASDSPGPNGTATPSASSSSSCVSAGYGNANNNGGVGDGGGGGGAGGAGGGGGGDDEDCRSIHLSSSTEDLDLENQAMRVVRTVGQAFEVCHKLSIGPGSPTRDDQDSEGASDKTTRKGALSTQLSVDGLEDSVQDSASYDESPRSPPSRSLRLDLQRPRSPQVHRKDMNGSPLTDELDSRDRDRDRDREPSAGSLGGGSLIQHEVQLLREQLEQQAQQTQAAMAQANLLRDQLAAEKAARMEAQARTHQLLGHNRELLDHITALVTHLQEQEGSGGSQPLQLAPQLSSAAKVQRWFELLQTPPLSRPESGFVSAAQSGDLGGSAGEAGDPGMTDTDMAAVDSAVSAALSRLPARKKNKLFKLKLGRNVTF